MTGRPPKNLHPASLDDVWTFLELIYMQPPKMASFHVTGVPFGGVFWYNALSTHSISWAPFWRSFVMGIIRYRGIYRRTSY